MLQSLSINLYLSDFYGTTDTCCIILLFHKLFIRKHTSTRDGLWNHKLQNEYHLMSEYQRATIIMAKVCLKRKKKCNKAQHHRTKEKELFTEQKQTQKKKN